jgi:hypothetical protein
MTIHEAVDRAAELYDTEVALREAARRIELDPDPRRQEEARQTFRRADAAGAARRALLRQCRLI